MTTIRSIFPSNVTYASTNALSALAQASATATQLANKSELDIINAQIQRQVARKITALQGSSDANTTSVAQSQVTNAQNQLKTLTALSPQLTHNANVLSDLTNQLATLQTAAAAGDSVGFDNALAQSNIDVADLTRIAPTAPFQPDHISTLMLNGIGIGSSASYDLSTAPGQAAAAADISAAQSLVGLIFNATTANQTLAGTLTTALNAKVTTLNAQINQQQQTDQATLTAQITQLSNQAQNQLHLIELALGKTQTVATALAAAMNPQQPVGSVFEALANGASGNTQNTTPAILSLLA